MTLEGFEQPQRLTLSTRLILLSKTSGNVKVIMIYDIGEPLAVFGSQDWTACLAPVAAQLVNDADLSSPTSLHCAGIASFTRLYSTGSAIEDLARMVHFQPGQT